MSLSRFPLPIILRSLAHTTKRGWVLTFFLWLAAFAPVMAAESVDLRVEIEEGVAEVTIGSSTKAVVRDGATGRSLGELLPMTSFAAKADAGAVALEQWKAGAVFVEPTGGGYVFIGDRWYRGRVLVVPDSQGLTVINWVDLEQYLYSVLGGEMNGNWPPEALKAQAVAARSYVLFHRNKATKRAYDVGDTTRWQVYRGLQDEAAGTQSAVAATAGEVLMTRDRQIIEAVFHSSAGGCTENVEEVWSQSLPYLRSVVDSYDEGAPVYEWTKTFSQAELSSLITGVGNITKFTVEKATSKCGRIISMVVEGDKGSRTLKGSELQNVLGLRSTYFRVDPIASELEQKSSILPITFQVTGRGFGHGLGLSQWGAYNMALRYGKNYKEILLHYYQNTEIGKIQPK